MKRSKPQRTIAVRELRVSPYGATICGPYILNTFLTPCCAVPASAYADGILLIGIQRLNGVGPIVKELALEEQTAAPTFNPRVPVSCTNLVNATVSGSTLTKINSNNWDGGAASSNAIALGEGYVIYPVDSTADYKFIGLTYVNVNASYTDIDYGFFLVGGGALQIFESGTAIGTFGSYDVGDSLKVAVESGVVKYYRLLNDSSTWTLLRSSTVAPTYPLVVDTSMYYVGATFSNVQLCTGTGALATSGLSFDANRTATGVSLQWRDSAEFQLDSFDIYRSTDNQIWTLVGRTAVSSNCTLQTGDRRYAQIDAGAGSSQTYYYQLVLNGERCQAGQRPYPNPALLQPGIGVINLWLPLIRK